MAKFWKPRGKVVLEGYQPTTSEGVDPNRPPRGGSALVWVNSTFAAPRPAPATTGEFQVRPEHRG